MKKVDIKSSGVICDDFFKIVETYLSYERFDERMSPVVRRLNRERGDSVAEIVFNITSQKVIVGQPIQVSYARETTWMDR
jgi:hypothetical protein